MDTKNNPANLTLDEYDYSEQLRKTQMNQQYQVTKKNQMCHHVVMYHSCYYQEMLKKKNDLKS